MREYFRGVKDGRRDFGLGYFQPVEVVLPALRGSLEQYVRGYRDGWRAENLEKSAERENLLW